MNNLREEIDPRDYRGLFTLVVGDVNSGKTTLCRRILEAFLAEGDEATILELSPLVREEDLRGGLKGVGGLLLPEGSGRVRLLRVETAPPRLRARTSEEAERLAEDNARKIESAFSTHPSGWQSLLFINDCSMYLQAGDPERLYRFIRTAETSVVNGYLGVRLGGGAISERERKGMEYLMGRCDNLIRL